MEMQGVCEMVTVQIHKLPLVERGEKMLKDTQVYSSQVSHMQYQSLGIFNNLVRSGAGS